MRRKLVSGGVQGCVAFWLVLSSASLAAAATATVSDWVGANNTIPPANYVVISPTSAGGTFEERITPGERPLTDAGQLSDQSLVGGPYGYLDDLSMAGTVTFNSPSATVDQTAFFGFYNSARINGSNDVLDVYRLGFTFADSTVGNLRVQMAANNGAATSTTTLDTNGNVAGGTAPLANGTYPFLLTFTAATRVFTATVGPISNQVTLATSYNADDIFDRFGFYQVVSTSTNATTLAALELEDEAFTFIVNGDSAELAYTGSTPIPEPATTVLTFLFAAASLVGCSRKRFSM